MAINYEDIFGAQPTAPQQSTKTYNLDDYLSFGKIEKEQTVNLDQALQELRGQLASGQYKKSLNDLEQNREFTRDAVALFFEDAKEQGFLNDRERLIEYWRRFSGKNRLSSYLTKKVVEQIQESF